MAKVICFGEALIDFLNINKVASGPLLLNQYCQFPGGAPANAAVAVSKLGGEAYFLGQVGKDVFGEFLSNALVQYGVNIDYLYHHPQAKTALAFVTLDEGGDRSFSFYRDNTADLLFAPEQVPDKLISAGDFLHICSNTLTESNSCASTQACIDSAQKAGAYISFDVNLRHMLWEKGSADRNIVNSFVEQAEVLKFALEELDFLSDKQHADYIERLMAGRCRLLVVTNGGGDVSYYFSSTDNTSSGYLSAKTPAPNVEVVDTTAGGDGFIGGLLFAILKCQQNAAASHKSSLIEPPLAAPLSWQADDLKRIVDFAVACGAFAVTKEGAFPALPTLTDIPPSIASAIATNI